jgi:hypothetical protein
MFCITETANPNMEITKYIRDGVHNSLIFLGNAIMNYN